MIAVVLASGRPERLHTALSLLVCTAAAGEPARGLATFAALEALLDPALEARALAGAALSADGAPVFARTLVELRDAAGELPDCRVWACAASAETTGADRAAIDRRLDGVLSMPRFLAEVAGARLVVV